MSLVVPHAHLAGSSGFPELLKTWRHKRRLSQLALALESGVSQRHVSFLESGRAKPSRDMIMQLSDTLNVPLSDRNDWLVAAGFAPVFRATALDDPQMAQVMSAVRMMLSNHAPYPAVAVDRAWNIRLANEPFERLLSLFGEHAWAKLGGAQRNLLRLFFHPLGIRPHVANWSTIAPLIWQRACREADAIGGQDMRDVLTELRALPHAAMVNSATVSDAPLLPVLPLIIEKDGMRISLFTVIATFGTAQDVTTDELRIESMFPADDATQELFRQMAIK